METFCHELPFKGERDHYHYLYKITSLVLEKPYYYIGRFSTLKDPRTDGYYGSGMSKWQRVLKKYGRSNFKKEILKFHKTCSELLESERQAIGELYKFDEWCCNLCKGGLGTFGYKFSKEVVQKISEANKGKRTGDDNSSRRPEVRKRISEGLMGRPCSQETREKMRQSRLGMVSPTLSDEQKRQNSLRQKEEYRNGRVPARGMLGRNHILLTKYKIAETKRGKPMQEITRLAIRKSRLGVPNPASEETKLKISVANRGKFWTEDRKKRASELAKSRGQTVSLTRKTCSYCGIVCSSSNYKRWHGENCKSRIV